MLWQTFKMTLGWRVSRKWESSVTLLELIVFPLWGCLVLLPVLPPLSYLKTTCFLGTTEQYKITNGVIFSRRSEWKYTSPTTFPAPSLVHFSLDVKDETSHLFTTSYTMWYSLRHARRIRCWVERKQKSRGHYRH